MSLTSYRAAPPRVTSWTCAPARFTRAEAKAQRQKGRREISLDGGIFNIVNGFLLDTPATKPGDDLLFRSLS